MVLPYLEVADIQILVLNIVDGWHYDIKLYKFF